MHPRPYAKRVYALANSTVAVTANAATTCTAFGTCGEWEAIWSIYFHLQPVRYPVTPSPPCRSHALGSPFPVNGSLNPRKNLSDVSLLITAYSGGHFTRLVRGIVLTASLVTHGFRCRRIVLKKNLIVNKNPLVLLRFSIRESAARIHEDTVDTTSVFSTILESHIFRDNKSARSSNSIRNFLAMHEVHQAPRVRQTPGYDFGLSHKTPSKDFKTTVQS